MMRSGHSFPRKVWLSVQAVYNIINLIASWFAIVRLLPNERQIVTIESLIGKLLLVLCHPNVVAGVTKLRNPVDSLCQCNCAGKARVALRYQYLLTFL